MRMEERLSSTPCPVWGGSGVEKRKAVVSSTRGRGKMSSGWWKETGTQLKERLLTWLYDLKMHAMGAMQSFF